MCFLSNLNIKKFLSTGTVNGNKFLSHILANFATITANLKRFFRYPTNFVGFRKVQQAWILYSR